MAKVKLSLKDLTIPQKIQFMRQIVTSMAGNANFATPSPTLITVTAKADDLETTYNDAQAARLAAQQKTNLQNDSVQTADATLTQLAAYVENITAGDTAEIQSAGMDVRSAGTPVGSLPAPTGLTASAGDIDGEIDLHWDSIRGTSSYVVQKSSDPITSTSWQPVSVVTKSKTTAAGLTSGSKYWFRIAAVGTAGQGPWSDPATKLAP